jgi:hypothetical protein
LGKKDYPLKLIFYITPHLPKSSKLIKQESKKTKMFTVNLSSSSGFSPDQQETLFSALKKFETVMNSDELKNRILNFSNPLGNYFEDNLGLSNQQVFEKIFAGEEVYKIGTDYTADLFLILVPKRKPPFSRNPAIGYGRPKQKEIYTYSWWFNDIADYEYAGHIAHEWSHKIGFDHSFSPTPTRDFSVPYAFGNIVEELAKKN